MGIIQPETGAIDNLKAVTVQESIVTTLEAIATAQKTINPLYDFKVAYNMFRPSIEDIENASLLNVLLYSMTPNDKSSKDLLQLSVVFYIDAYVLGQNENTDVDIQGRSLLPADEVASQRLQYLVSMAFYGITALGNYYKGLPNGDISPKYPRVSFDPVQNASSTAEQYAPARIIWECLLPYPVATLANLPDLSEVFTRIKLGSSTIVSISNTYGT